MNQSLPPPSPPGPHGSAPPGPGFPPVSTLPGPPPPHRPGKGVAIAALVCGIAGALLAWIPVIQWLVLLLAPAAVILGIIALAQSRGPGGGQGLAVGGIVLGALSVVFFILALVFSLILMGAQAFWMTERQSDLQSLFSEAATSSATAGATPTASSTPAPTGEALEPPVDVTATSYVVHAPTVTLAEAAAGRGAQISVGAPTGIDNHLPVTLTNTSGEDSAYRLEMELTVNGELVGLSALTVTEVAAGQSYETSAFTVDDPAGFTDAEVTVVSVTRTPL